MGRGPIGLIAESLNRPWLGSSHETDLQNGIRRHPVDLG